MNFIAQSSLTYLHKHLKLHKIMKKVWICRVVEYNDYSIVNEKEISEVFSSEKKAKAYCNWFNKENDADSIFWMRYTGFTVETMDYDKVPF